MKRPLALACLACLVFANDGTRADRTTAAKTLADYRYFRALSIDLVGRPPLVDELAAYEQPDFVLDRWLDKQLASPEYAERITRVYLDLLRLEVPQSVLFHTASTDLQATHVLDPNGRDVTLYFRQAQRRRNAAIDGQVCFTEDESGLKVPHDAAAIGSPKPIPKALWDARTVLVKPWWLYADYRAKDPQDRASPDWVQRFGGFELMQELFVERDKTPMTAVRVCREEAQTAEQGKVFVTGRTNVKGPVPAGRLTRPPSDSRFAIANSGKLVSCITDNGVKSSAECGCGIGLERCLPSGPPGFMMPTEAPLGVREPFQKTARPAHLWMRTWWTEEASHFMARIFEDDRDVRELLTSRATTVNGPLALFYRTMSNSRCCGDVADLFGYTTPEPLFDPAAVPANVVVQDTTTWVTIADRGPHAAGLMTMPIFLLKYGTRRQRAHAVYSTFLCKDFVANNVKLQPSQEPDLTKRPGCATCHTRLEPLAAYFTRIPEGNWTYLPPALFPISLDRCKQDPKNMHSGCKIYYDPAFTSTSHTVLRGAHASPHNADAGPQGLATEITSSPEFAPCVVKNVAESLLGRPLTAEDGAWQTAMAKTFVDGGFRMRALVRAIVTAPAYRDVNDQRSGR